MKRLQEYKISGCRHPPLPLDIQPPPPPDMQPPCSNLSLSTIQVRNKLRKIKAKKVMGRDGISSRLLKSCADQLCRIVEYIFNIRPKPLLWKTTCVPRIPHLNDFNSNRPFALTSHLMKTLVQLVLVHLRPLMGPVCLSTWHRSGRL